MNAHTDYLFHLLVWMIPVLILQWIIAPKILRHYLREILLAAGIIGTYYALADSVAVNDGIWHFDSSRILNIRLGVLPIEEILFFYLTALMAAQGFVMLMGRKGESA